jgi:hypothetical protein
MKLSKLIQKLERYKSKLNIDPEVSIAGMPDIKIKLKQDFSLSLRGGEESINVSQQVHSSELCLAEFGVNAYHSENFIDIVTKVDTHGMVRDNLNGQAVIPIEGFYIFNLTYMYDCDNNPDEILVTSIKRNEYYLLEQSNYNKLGCTISNQIFNSTPLFLKKGDRISVEMPVDKNFRWELGIRRVS